MYNLKCPIQSNTPNQENSKTKIYYGISQIAFNLRYPSHKKTFNNITYQTDIESKQISNVISASKTSNTSSEILGTYKSYNRSPKQCLLCLNEKLAITQHKDDNMLNKKSDLISKCRHRNRNRVAQWVGALQLELKGSRF